MQEMMTILLDGVENIAKNMKEFIGANPAGIGKFKDLEQRVEKLAVRMDKLTELLETRTSETTSDKPRGRRMMDIKQRIHDVIARYPDGIRPPQIAQIIGTKVQNLYPHLKTAIEKKQLRKTDSGTYALVSRKTEKKK